MPKQLSGTAVPAQKHRLSPSRRRALELLATSPDGATKESLVLVHGISRDTIAGLVRTRLASARRETAKGGAKRIRGWRYRITNAGRSALEGWPPRLIHPAR
jgi:hypothetical protein